MKFFRSPRKVYMTLLETLIAMTLLSVLLTFVFGFFRELAGLTSMTEQTQKESFHMRYLESRLGFIFERLVNESIKARTFYFYTQPPHQEFTRSNSLIFTFNNEVRLDPTFSGDVLGRLYVDLNHCLCLATWPLFVPEPDKYLQEEVLLNHVMAINYFFYAAPERKNTAKQIQSGKNIDPGKLTPEKDKWHENEWALTYDQMPSIIKLELEVAKNPDAFKQGDPGIKIDTHLLTFYFTLPSSKNPVHYSPDE